MYASSLFILASFWGGDFFSIHNSVEAVRNVSVKAPCSAGYTEMNSEFQNTSIGIFFSSAGILPDTLALTTEQERVGAFRRES